MRRFFVLSGWVFRVAVVTVSLGAVGCTNSDAALRPPLSPAAALGKQMFNDRALSASGTLSCASCHNPVRAHTAGDGRAVPLGGPAMNRPGFRNEPSLRYLDQTPPFSFNAEGKPVGGLAWDGRAQTLAEQALAPLTAPHEMANKDAAEIVARVRRAPYAAEFRAVYGPVALDDPPRGVQFVLAAIGAFETEDPSFHPYDSKYDAYLADKVQLSEQELRGLKAFNDPERGNCAACHPSARGARGEPPLFTDFSYDALGVPRNPEIPATADPNYYDLGLCGPDRKDLAARKDLCGMFKVPTLRNIAVTAPYFHNGRFNTLREAVAFYARRDTNPEEWYPRSADGRVLKFDDLPPQYRANVNTDEVPYHRKPGPRPAISSEDVDDIAAFLQTLTDGYRP